MIHATRRGCFGYPVLLWLNRALDEFEVKLLTSGGMIVGKVAQTVLEPETTLEAVRGQLPC
jgi:hypothetical protein